MSRFARRVYLHLAALAATVLAGSVWGLSHRWAWTFAVLIILSGVMTIHGEVGRLCGRVVLRGYESTTYCIIPTGHKGVCRDRYGEQAQVEGGQ